MTRHRLMTAISIVALLATGAVTAGEIYKWTDEDGNVHYVDRPSGQPDEARLDIISRRTDNAAVMARVEQRQRERATREQVATEAPDEMSKEEVRKEQAERQEKCQQYRDRLEQFLRSTRLYKEGEAGERQYLNEEETMAARRRVQQQIEKYCGA